MEKKEYQLNFNVNISALTEVKNILQDISLQLQELGKQTEKDIFGKMFDFADKASSIGSFLISFSGMNKDIPDDIKKLEEDLKKEGKDLETVAKKIGGEIAEGLADGIKKAFKKIEIVSQELADDNVIRTVMKTLEISENVYTFAKGFT